MLLYSPNCFFRKGVGGFLVVGFLIVVASICCFRSAAVAALMMGDELHKSGRIRPGRNDFSQIGLGGATSPSSRQIYLTFPADSTFREEDVSNYFRSVFFLVFP